MKLKYILTIVMAIIAVSAGVVYASGAETKTPTVYFTSDISPKSLINIYEALGWMPTGTVGVKISTGEPPASNYLRPELIGDLVGLLDANIVECMTAYKPVAGSFLLTENILQRIRINNRNHRRGIIESEPGNLAPAGAKLESINWHQLVPKQIGDFPDASFFSIGFSHHRTILSKVKNTDERIFYIRRCAKEKYSREALEASIARDDYHHQGSLPNNFMRTISTGQQALKAISTFKDEYLLDYINVEELDVRDRADVDEKLVENAIIHNVKNFILTFGKDFAFVRNQYHLDAFGEGQYIDLLSFNRELNCLVAVELKTGKFKTSYLGQLQGYLSILDGFERKPHENPAIGIILCKDVNKSFVDYVIQDYTRPMGVATYKTSKDMSEELRKALPDIEDLRRLLDTEEG